jgi:hypothetical protein
MTVVRETTAGVTPNTPRMRTARYTGESLAFNPEYLDSNEIRADRMLGDPILAMQSSAGGVNVELSFPDDESPMSEFLRSSFFNTWTVTPTRFNDGTADSVITDVATTGVITVTTGATFAVGHLIRTTGFGVAQNNGLFRITTASATVPSVGSSLLALEAAPAAAARVKVVGFEGTSGDITATATGLAATSLNFTTLGLAVGQVIKIGGTLTANRFNTAANNAFCRITAIAASALTLDNLPTGWAIDAGTGKTIRVFFGDQIKNGVTPTSLSIERAFLGQNTPTYIINRGMQVNTFSLEMATRSIITGSFDFMGMGGGQSTTALDASPDVETTSPVMSANANFQRFAEAGVTVIGPDYIRSASFQISNNLRMIESLGSLSPVDIVAGECTVTGRAEFYFGSNAILAKFYAGTPTSILMAAVKDGKGVAFQFPRVTYRGGTNPSATGKNTDVMLALDFTASKDTLTNASILMDRFDYVEI